MSLHATQDAKNVEATADAATESAGAGEDDVRKAKSADDAASDDGLAAAVAAIIAAAGSRVNALRKEKRAAQVHPTRRTKPFANHRVTLAIPNEKPFILDSSSSFGKLLFGDDFVTTLWNVVRSKIFLAFMALIYFYLAPSIIYDIHYKTAFSVVGILNLIAQTYLFMLINPNMLVHALSQFELQYASFNVVAAIATAMYMFDAWHIKIGLLSASLFLLNITVADAWPTRLRRQTMRYFNPLMLIYTTVLCMAFVFEWAQPENTRVELFGIQINLIGRFLGFTSMTIMLQVKSIYVSFFRHRDRLPVFWFNMRIQNNARIEGLDNLIGLNSIMLERDSLARVVERTRPRRFSYAARIYASNSKNEKFSTGLAALQDVGKVDAKVLLEHESAGPSRGKGKRSLRIVYPEKIPFVVKTRDTVGTRLIGRFWTNACVRFIRHPVGFWLSTIAVTGSLIAAMACNYARFAFMGPVTSIMLFPIILIWVPLYNVRLLSATCRTWSVIYFNMVLWVGGGVWMSITTNSNTRAGVLLVTVAESVASCMDAFPVKLMRGHLRAWMTFPFAVLNIHAFIGLFFDRFDTVKADYIVIDVGTHIHFSKIDVVLTALFATSVYCVRNLIACIRRPDCFVNLVMHARASRASAALADAVVEVFHNALSENSGCDNNLSSCDVSNCSSSK